jgi:hypothetical protein
MLDWIMLKYEEDDEELCRCLVYGTNLELT